jgi:hypothetical protein
VKWEGGARRARARERESQRESQRERESARARARATIASLHVVTLEKTLNPKT